MLLFYDGAMPNNSRPTSPHLTAGAGPTERQAEPLKHQTDIARAAALIADPSRARILKGLADGRALPASVLAGEAGIGAATASVHLAKLVEENSLPSNSADGTATTGSPDRTSAPHWRLWR